MVPAQTCVTVMSVVPNLTFFRVVLRFTVAILSCGAVVDETFSVRERSDVASRFANTFFEKKGGPKSFGMARGETSDIDNCLLWRKCLVYC